MLRERGGAGRFCALCFHYGNVNNHSKAAAPYDLGFEDGHNCEAIDHRRGNLPTKVLSAEMLLPVTSPGLLSALWAVR